VRGQGLNISSLEQHDGLAAVPVLLGFYLFILAGIFFFYTYLYFKFLLFINQNQGMGFFSVFYPGTHARQPKTERVVLFISTSTHQYTGRIQFRLGTGF
jgi:hypothetical protein